ncbi:P1 family peptidase [Legionella septentrionalis]|uniref:P1 family peptidase n=1 Tax=Legionella septentrionalis TaxID=2498109 RepID=UPI000F8D37C8|nr:P1 family peptidase [Legionella septentrionalis]RUR02955.1 peptidase S58 family protein [Legionella septentrionalis]
MQGLKINHVTDMDNGTGASIFLFEQGAIGSYLIVGSACATHEVAVLEPEHSVPCVHGLMLAGGSTFGLFAVQGMVRYLHEKEIGFHAPNAIVPLVPAAALYDLSYKHPVPPSANEVYQACFKASEHNEDRGILGAGTGATVGKLIASASPMKSGMGRAAIKLDSGLEVIAYAAVNAVGDVHDKGNIVAGARFADGSWADTEKRLLAGESEQNLFANANTTLIAVFTNAKGDKASLKRMAKMTAAGFSQAISPIFSPYDGDIIFCFSLGNLEVSELMLGTIAAEQVRLAILDAVKNSL